MGNNTNSLYFYHDKPLFGLDIGFGKIRAMQINTESDKLSAQAYGSIDFSPEAIKDGAIVDFETLAKAMYELFDKKLVGTINTRRVAVSIPASRTYARSIELPAITEKEIDEAVHLDAEQYIPLPAEAIYLDHLVSKQTGKQTHILTIAVPKKIIDSYLSLLKIVNLEPVLIETSISAGSRLFNQSNHNDIPTVLIDFGSKSADITIYDKTLTVTGTVPCGGDVFTDLIANKLGVTKQAAGLIKSKYGLDVSKKQDDIKEALTPVLEQLLKEIRRVMRYYEERFSSANGKIGQIVTMGGGANMPGLSEYMTNSLRLPVRMCNPWENIDFGKLQPPSSLEKSIYATVSGLALIKPKEIFA